jgi:hypothetical protein
MDDERCAVLIGTPEHARPCGLTAVVWLTQDGRDWPICSSHQAYKRRLPFLQGPARFGRPNKHEPML